MQNLSLKSLIIIVRICTGIFVACLLSLILFSFTIKRIPFDFLSQLGISKTEADQKITSSIIGGYLNYYGVRSAKSIAVGDRETVVKDLLAYTKQHVSSPAFMKEYTDLKNRERPVINVTQTPEEMRTELIAAYKKAVTDNEKVVKTADASLKPIFENALAQAKKVLAEAEDPNNKNIAAYTKNYPAIVKMNEASYKQQMELWEKKYPANQLLFVKERLEQFLKETDNVDYNAALVEKNGKKYFVNKTYESRSRNWKMAFRAGKEVTEPARSFVEQWLVEINR